MRSKAPLALMEQLVMVLVFALAAALCVQAFVLSDQTSRRNEARDRAVLEAQNAAEELKSVHGDFQQMTELYGAVGMAGSGGGPMMKTGKRTTAPRIISWWCRRTAETRCWEPLK